MTSVMNADIRRTIAVLLTVALVGGSGPVHADEYGEGAFQPSQPSVVGEAAKAVVDRVFGVKGEAADIRYHAVELSNHSPVNAGIRSAIVPGWGQWFNRQPVKAVALFMVVAGGAYGTIRMRERSSDSYDEYKAFGIRSGPEYDDYERQRSQALILGSATLFLWGYTVWDAYRNAYNPLWSKDTSVDVALLSDGAAVEWRKKF
jgi:hypothetical protein